MYAISEEKVPTSEQCDINGCYPIAEFKATYGEDDMRRLMRADEPVIVKGALTMRSPWVWRAHMQGELIIVEPPVGAVIYFNIVKGSTIAIPAGTSRNRNFRIQLQDANGKPCTLEEEPVYLKMADERGRKVRFDAETGRVVSMTSADGKVVLYSQYEEATKQYYDSEGNLQAAWSNAEGLMNTYYTDDGQLVMEWFSPENVVKKGSRYAGKNVPYRTVSYLAQKYPDGALKVTITRQQAGLPPHKTVRVEHGNRITITKGEGDEAIVRTYVTNELGGGRTEIIESLSNGAGVVASVTRTVKKRTSGGWLTESETEAYNTPLAQTTEYVYGEDAYHVKRIVRPDGSFTSYEYDDEWRIIKTQEPWAQGIDKITRRTYQKTGFYDTKLASETISYELESGEEIELSRTEYEYTGTPEVERTVTKKYAAGTDQVQESVSERYGEDTALYAAGKVKYTRTIAGLETHYTYEATADYGAMYKSVAITKAEGALVAGQSRRTVSYISDRGATLREEECIWDGEQWIKLSGATYEYDEEGRRTKTTRDNGRVSTTVWMCCGILRETDENGIRTSYAYNSALQNIETTRSEVYIVDECVTPEIITEYERDAAGRVLRQTQHTGAMIATESTGYDMLGRVIRQVDALGNVTTTSYNINGLTTTVTQPNGATLITTRDAAGNVVKQSGTGQREVSYAYTVEGDDTVRTTKAIGCVLSVTRTNGFGQQLALETPSTHGFISTYSQYNVKGQLVKQWREAGEGGERPAPTLYAYDAFGNITKQITALSDAPDKTNSPIVETTYCHVEVIDGGVYSVTTQTTYNAQGEPLTNTSKQLVSALSNVLASKQIRIDARGNATSAWTEYGQGAAQINYTKLPTSTVVETAVVADGFTIFQTGSTNVTTRQNRQYGTAGMVLRQTDGRGNTTTIRSDLLGRTVRVTDAAGNSTTTAYEYADTQPSRVTDALGNTACYQYDLRGRKVAEYGTGIQPATFGYDDADNLTRLTTYRAKGKVVSTNPDGLDGDTTTWVYDLATGLELSITYANGKGTINTYDAYNNLATQTNARGIVTTYSYDIRQGVLTGITFSDDTPAQRFTYNFLGKLTSITDASGIRSISYDSYGNLSEENIQVGSLRYTTQEHWDAYGRSTGYVLQKDGMHACEVSQGYSANGRIARAGFIHEEAEHSFLYHYLPGSDLLQILSMPNGVMLTQSYEEKRNLLTGMDYVRENSLVTQRRYTYDALARPETRDTRYPNKSISHHDSFAYNRRSELTGALLDASAYTYAYDNIGNREIAQEAAEGITYAANELNQYTRISTDGENFTPEYDADGNQTLVQTSTGIWRVTYNAQNRAVKFESTDGSTIITCAYDYMGRRFEKRIEQNGQVIRHRRYLYRGYLQIAAVNLKEDASPPDLWHLIWDPTQPTATRPLALLKDGTWYTYGWDLTKNVCEIYGQEGYIRTIYRYTPYGTVTAEGDVDQSPRGLGEGLDTSQEVPKGRTANGVAVSQPIQWSSEYHDSETALTYYNYRYYNPLDGRWTRRDVIFSSFYSNAYAYAHNTPSHKFDKLGNDVYIRINKADVCFGDEAAKLDIYHMWIKTDKYEAGLGNQNGVPGENGQTSPDCPCSKTFVRDHTNRDYIDQRKVENVIENCVNAYISSNLNQYQGRWIPLYNDCNAYVNNIISNCTPQKRLKRIDVSGARICPFGMIGGHITGMYIAVYGVIYPNNRFVEIK